MSSRRSFLRAGAGVATATWLAPSVLSLDRVAAAAPSSICEVPSVADGAVWLDPSPPSTAEGQPVLDSNTNTFVWAEAGPFQLANDLTVNRVSAGTFDGGSNEAATIAAGTWICSYFVHGDRLDDNGFLLSLIHI